MANTTLSQLTSIIGTDVAATDSFLIYDVSANTEKQITASELKNMIGNGTLNIGDGTLNIGNGSLTVTTSGTTDALIVTSTDGSSTAAPDIVFYRNSPTPNGGDNMGNIVFRGKNSSGSAIEYASIGSTLTSPTEAAEKGNLIFSTMFNGTFAEKARIRDDGGFAIGGNGGPATVVTIAKDLTGGTSSYGLQVISTVNTDVTSSATGFRTNMTTAANVSVTNFRHYDIAPLTLGANTVITSQFGFNSSGLTAANNNFQFYAASTGAASIVAGKTAYGFYSANPIATGGGTTWNFYANGTAPNYFNGVVTIGSTTPDASKLYVSGNTYVSTTVTTGGNITSGAQIAGKYTALANGTTAMALATNHVVSVTPITSATYTTTVAPAGSRATILIVTSGTASYTITFGTGFKTTGTLATGTVTAKTFAINFVSDGTTMIETGRTTAM